MKRHASLRDLSMDHHHGLVHARRLQKAAAGEDGSVSASDVAREFLFFFANEANRHFREEEEVLLPAYARHSDISQEPVIQMLLEHVQIRRLVADLHRQLEEGATLDLETMREAGALLQAHIRLEENVIFPLIERGMPEEALAELAAQLQEFATVHDPST
jgi:hemerythrin-like domain-containing protein